MSQILGFLLSRWFLSFIGTALLAILVWFFGPLLAPLESWIVRLIIVLLMFVMWAGVNLLLDLLKRRRDADLTAGLTASADDMGAAAKAEEVAALREKLTTALTLLKSAHGTRGYLYEQPWYAIIGPPGAGKTTALLNAGLRFPLAAEMGQDAVAGVGGTRLCDWWFTDEAVLIDTSGRYTTQDSDAAVDRVGWEAFLDLLKRTRVRQPLNGVLVAIGLNDIARAPQAERIAHARAIRSRVKELEAKLGARMPVYLLFTKADLIAGFTEFFGGLDRDRRDQVWGTTFPLQAGEAGYAASFAAEFRALVDRLDDQLLSRMQEERGADQRAMIAGFPAQIASLEQPLTAFIQEAFGGSRLERAPMLRGVYFTSGTQEGTPIDRLTGSLSRAFGLDQRRLPSLRPEQGKSYFLGWIVAECYLRRGPACLRASQDCPPPHAASCWRFRRRRTGLHPCRRHDVGRAERWSARHRRDAAGLGGLREDSPRHAPRPGQRRRPAASCAAAGSGARVAVRCRPSRRPRRFLEFRAIPGRQAGGRVHHRLSPCARSRPAAATDLAARGADARQAEPAGLPVRGNQGLPDAGRQRPGVRSRLGARLDDAGLAGHLSRHSVRRSADGIDEASGRTVGGTAAGGATGRQPGSPGAQHVQPRVAGAASIFAHQALGRRADACRPGDRVTRWARLASECSSAPPASRWTTASQAS